MRARVRGLYHGPVQGDWAGQRLGQYELLRQLGSGGMGEVWLARQEGLGRQVAVKILSSATDQRSVDRLRREAQALARIRHPHVVPVHEVGEHNGIHYYVMELVEGRSLDVVLASGPLDCRRAAALARQVALALAAAHEQGVIHRDVKPGNVLLADERDHATLVDFGLALSESASTLTRTGEMLGTPYYMAPEQARGDAARADARTDVWGTGATLYEMITGKKPFGDQHWLAVQMAVLDSDPEPPRRHRPDCPADLETIVMRCLEKDPERRYATARDLADDLERLLADEPILARPPSLGHQIRKSARRHRIALRVGAATAVLAALGFTGWQLAQRAAEREREAVEAAELVRIARALAERGETGEAWSRLREVELRFSHTPAVIDAYWAMTDLARGGQREGDVLAQEIWLTRLLEAHPPEGDAARAHWRLGRLYDKHGLVDDAHAHYAQATANGALAPADLDDARFGLAWTAWLGRHVDAELPARVLGAIDLDLDRDGRGDRGEVVLAYEPTRGLVALGLRAGRLEVVRRWTVATPDAPMLASTWMRISFADVDGDGRPDLIATDGVTCVMADLSGPQLRRVVTLSNCHWIAVGDLDGDHRPELAVSSIQPRRALLLVRVAPDGSTSERVLDDLSVDETDTTGLAIADLDGDGRAELIYAGGGWTRYDVRVARVEGDALRVIARTQVGLVNGLDALDMDGDGRPEIFAVKSHASANPRLFDDDPYLGPSGPMVLRLTGGRLERTWLDPLVPAASPEHTLDTITRGRRTRLGSLSVVRSGAAPLLHLYFGRAGGVPMRRDLRRIGAMEVGGGVTIADLDGDGDGELVLGGGRVAAYGIGPAVSAPHLDRHRTGSDWLSTARQLRDARDDDLALAAYRAAAAHGADPAVIAFEEGGCHAQARRWERALASFRSARAAGRRDAALWRATLDAAEAIADWPTALEAARELGDAPRAAALEQLSASRAAFFQDFAEPLRAEWRVEEPLACRGPTGDGGLGLTLLPGDHALALGVDWDGSSFEASAVVALRDVQYAKGIAIEIAPDGGPAAGGGGISGGGGGGVLSMVADLHAPVEVRATPVPTDWSVLPERLVLTLSYVAHAGQWQVALRDLGGQQLRHVIARAAGRPSPGRYTIRWRGHAGPYQAASIVDVYRIELRAAPGALRVIAPAAADPPPRCARDLAPGLAPAGEGSPLHRAFALAAAGRIDDAARELSAWRPAASARPSARGFELDEHALTEWEAGLVRLALLDEALASAVVEAGRLMPPREWGVLLRRLIYQQHVDSGQTHWREAVVGLRRVTALAPDDPHAWYILGYCRYRLGDLAGARAAFERAGALDPAIERRYPKQGGPAIFLARVAGRERDAAAATRWLTETARLGGNLDIARHDRALRDLLGPNLRQLVGD